MTDVLRITRLKMLDLLNRPVMLVLLVILPVLLGSIAGVANLRNVGKHIYLAVVDEDRSAASSKVITDLQDKGWTIYPSDAKAAQRKLVNNEVDGVLTIEAGFDSQLHEFDNSHLTYVEAEGSMVTSMIREVVVASVLPLFSQDSMLSRLEELYISNGQTPPADLQERFLRRIEELRTREALIHIEYHGNLVVTPTLTFVVSDYSMEVFFLSIYAVLGTISLSKAAMRQRLGATARGLALDYLGTQISLFVLGLAQILLYTFSMLLLMGRSFTPREFLILAVFLFLVIGIGQLLAAIEESLRLYLSLLLLLFSAVMGGCFFQLSHRLLLDYGQYSPHGWALSALRGTRVTPVWIVIPTGAIFILIGYYLQKKRLNQTSG